MGRDSRYIIDISQSHREDVTLVGKKAHELGILSKLGILIPKGFVITTEFFKEFLCSAGIDKEIEKIKSIDHPAISDSVKKLYDPFQKQIMHAYFPQSLSIILHRFYRRLAGTFKERPINIFSSGAGNKTILFSNIKGDANLVLKIKEIYSQTPNDIMSIVVQENIDFAMKGKTTTDDLLPDKKLTNAQMQKLTNYCKETKKHFYFPQEIEYGIKNSNVYIAKINPFTGEEIKYAKQIFKKRYERKIIAKGVVVNPGIATGTVKIINKKDNMEIGRNEIAVLSDLNRSTFKKIKNAKAVIADSILQNGDKASYKKSFQIPTIVGAKNATKILKNKNVITINGISGEIYSGGLQY